MREARREARATAPIVESEGARRRPETEAASPETMRIGWAPSDDGGCGYYRIIDPCREVERSGLAECVLVETEAAAAACDVVVCQRVYSPVDADMIVRLRRRGCLVVYDTDDAIWELDETILNPATAYFREAHRTEILVDAMQESDLVTVTTDALAGQARRFCEHVEVLPNRVDVPRWDAARAAGRKYARGGHEVVIGYAGSNSHERDWRMVAGALAEIDRKYAGRLLWRFLGDPAVLWRWSDVLGENPVEVYPWTAFPSYPSALTALDLDIGLCPLWPHSFNAGKSAVKAWEMGLSGAAVVASDFGPYSTLRDGKDALLCAMPGDWQPALSRLIESPALRAGLRDGLAARVRGECCLAGHGGDWVSVFWRHLLRIRGQEERWLYHSRKWASPHRPSVLERIAEVERRAKR